MTRNNYSPPEISAFIYLALGIGNLLARDYVAGIAWTSLSISQFIIQRIGSWPSNMFRLDRPEVIFAWMTYLVFAVLILYHVTKLVQGAFFR